MVVTLCPNLKLSHAGVYQAMLKLNSKEGFSFLGPNPTGTCRHLSSCLRKALEWFRSIAVVPEKRKQVSKVILGQDWAEVMKVISSVDTSSHKDDDML